MSKDRVELYIEPKSGLLDMSNWTQEELKKMEKLGIEPKSEWDDEKKEKNVIGYLFMGFGMAVIILLCYLLAWLVSEL